MAVTVLMSIEGVLVREEESWDTGQPIPEGRLMYAALCREARLILYSIRNEGERGDEWLRMNGFREHSRLLVPGLTTDERLSTVLASYAFAAGQLRESINMVIDPDPEVIAAVMKRGTIGVLWAHPQYALPGARPEGRGAKPWLEITQEMDRQRDERKRVEAALEPEMASEDEAPLSRQQD